MGNIRRARQLFDAATVADKKHVAAWHGWAVLEIKQGNIKKARHLLAKGLKYCGRNEYIYQTLALLEARANRYQQARYLFKQATDCNPNSCASWLVRLDLLIYGMMCFNLVFLVMAYKIVFILSNIGLGTIGDATGKQSYC